MLIADTHALIWIGAGNPKLSKAAEAALLDPSKEIVVSAVTACEYVDLHQRGRIPDAADFSTMQRLLHFTVIDLPASVWRIMRTLPAIHLDPVDRMLVAHAIEADLTLITIDADMRRYPVKTTW